MREIKLFKNKMDIYYPCGCQSSSFVSFSFFIGHPVEHLKSERMRTDDIFNLSNGNGNACIANDIIFYIECSPRDWTVMET